MSAPVGYERRSRLDHHPLVAYAVARLRNAEREAERVPFPYPEGTPVLLVTPVQSQWKGRVASCDPEGWLVVESIDAPEDWADPVMHFYATTFPEAIRDGVIVLQTMCRIKPEAGTS